MAEVRRRGLLLVLSSPSGAGKTSISRRLLADESGLVMSVSATTRAKRTGEVDGTDYHFVDAAAFARMADGGELLEHAEVFGNRYGTPRAPVETALRQGTDVLFDIDWQGARQLRESALARDIVSVFVLPPSAAELHRRLVNRASDSEEVVRHRMAKASGEIEHWDAYDYVLVNADIDDSVATVRAILRAERHRLGRQEGMTQFVESIRRSLERG